MHPTPKKQFTVLAHRTGDGYYDIDRYMPSDRVREADADWLKWREDVKRAMEGIDTALTAAEGAIPANLAAGRGSLTNISPDPDVCTPNPEHDPIQALIAAQRDAIDVAKAHLAIAIEGQEQAGKQSWEDKSRADSAQRQARIANYFAAGAFLVGALGLLYGVLA